MQCLRLPIFTILLTAVAVIAGCSTASQPVHTSPDGLVSIREVLNAGGDSYLLAFEIIDQGKPPQRFVTRASTVHRYEFLWHGGDAFTIDSSDIGFLRYERGTHGGWVEGEVTERAAPDQKHSASIDATSDGRHLQVSVSERFPAGGWTGEQLNVIPLAATMDDVPLEYFVNSPRRNKLDLTARVLEWDGNDALIVRLKQQKVRIVKDGNRWIVERDAAR